MIFNVMKKEKKSAKLQVDTFTSRISCDHDLRLREKYALRFFALIYIHTAMNDADRITGFLHAFL